MILKSIDVSESVYERLTKQIKSFDDTPNLVIERLLDEIEGINSKPKLVFYPDDEARFKRLLLRNRKAEVALFKNDGQIEVLVWNASKLQESSNIKANIWSGYLRNWEEKNIKKAEFSIYEKPIDHFKADDFFKLCEKLSPIINVPYKFLIEYDFEHDIETHKNTDTLILRFHDGQDFSLLEQNKFFNKSTKCIEVNQHEVDYPFS